MTSITRISSACLKSRRSAAFSRSLLVEQQNYYKYSSFFRCFSSAFEGAAAVYDYESSEDVPDRQQPPSAASASASASASANPLASIYAQNHSFQTTTKSSSFSTTAASYRTFDHRKQHQQYMRSSSKSDANHNNNSNNKPTSRPKTTGTANPKTTDVLDNSAVRLLYDNVGNITDDNNDNASNDKNKNNDDISPAVRQLIEEYAAKDPTPASLQMLIKTGQGEFLAGDDSENNNTNTNIPNHHVRSRAATARILMQMASFLRHEIPIRLAHRIQDLDQVPMLRHMQAVKQVKKIYIDSFLQLVQFNQHIHTATDEENFAALLTNLYQKHASVLVDMAKGAFQLRETVRTASQVRLQQQQQQQQSEESNEDSEESQEQQYDNPIDAAIHNHSLNNNNNNNKSMTQEELQKQEQEQLEFERMKECHHFLDRFYLSRIGIRVLAGQYLALRADFHQQQMMRHRGDTTLVGAPHSQNSMNKDDQNAGDYIGMICQRTNTAQIVRQAAADATLICRRTYGRAPMIHVQGRLDLTFPFIPTYLHYILLELLKNSLRATMEQHANGSSPRLPPVTVIIADGTEQEDVVIKIMDEGGGIPRSRVDKIWSYLYTTADPKVQESFLKEDEEDGDEREGSNNNTGGLRAVSTNTTTPKKDHSKDSPLAGLGYGLPISRDYCRYFGGDLDLISMEGFGTDTFIHLKRLGDSIEPIPAIQRYNYNKTSRSNNNNNNKQNKQPNIQQQQQQQQQQEQKQP